ncbi:MAG: FG-GAP repeat domain-containing protein [Candidatus Methylomirabilia bacterium]
MRSEVAIREHPAGMRLHQRVMRIAAAVVITLSFSSAAAGAPAISLRDAMEAAVRTLFADLFAERPEGEVVSMQDPRDLIVRFPGAAPPADAEYLLLRPPDPGGSGLPETVGVARIAEGRGQVARAVVLWSDGDLRPGDRLRWPSRLTIVLLPTETEDAPELARSARRLDRWLELELLTARSLRVVRADQPSEKRWQVTRLRQEREYALIVAPLLISGTDGVEVVLRIRSLFTGQTLAQRRAVWTSARAQASPPPAPSQASPPPAPAQVSPPPAPASPAPSAYGAAIRQIQPQAAIQRAERSRGHASVALPQPLVAIALGDVDGDGRPEIVGITHRQVVVYRWTGRGVAPLAVDDPLPDAFTSYLHVDTGDFNGNGKDEVVLTAVRTVARGNRMENELASAIAEVRKGRFEYLFTDFDRYLRVLHTPGNPPVLLAQAMGAYEPFQGPVRIVEWEGARYRIGSRFPVSSVTESLYAFGTGDLDGDGSDELAIVSSDGRLLIYDGEGRLRWEADDSLGTVEGRGFAQTPRYPDYRGRNFDAYAESLAVWRSLPRRVVIAPPIAGTSEVVTIANPQEFGLRISIGNIQAPPGRAIGYGWDAQSRQFSKRWESMRLSGQALDLALADLGGDGRVELVVLSAGKDNRFLEVFNLYDQGGSPQTDGTGGR